MTPQKTILAMLTLLLMIICAAGSGTLSDTLAANGLATLASDAHCNIHKGCQWKNGKISKLYKTGDTVRVIEILGDGYVTFNKDDATSESCWGRLEKEKLKPLDNIKLNYRKEIKNSRPRLVKFYEAAGLTPDKLITNLGKYVPVEVLSRCTRFFTPELDKQTIDLLTKANDKKLPKGMEIGLHATKSSKAWDTIRTEGLKPGRHEVGSEDEIFHARNAAGHENAFETWIYTTLTYGAENDVGGMCRFVISLLTESSTPARETYRYDADAIKGWLTSKRKNTIPLWMVEIDTLVFLELIIRKYGIPSGDLQNLTDRILKYYKKTELAGYRISCKTGGTAENPCRDTYYCRICHPTTCFSHVRRLAEREFTSNRDSPVMRRLLEQIMNANY